jgi:hypothetical protein
MRPSDTAAVRQPSLPALIWPWYPYCPGILTVGETERAQCLEHLRRGCSIGSRCSARREAHRRPSIRHNTPRRPGVISARSPFFSPSPLSRPRSSLCSLASASFCFRTPKSSRSPIPAPATWASTSSSHALILSRHPTKTPHPSSVKRVCPTPPRHPLQPSRRHPRKRVRSCCRRVEIHHRPSRPRSRMPKAPGMGDIRRMQCESAGLGYRDQEARVSRRRPSTRQREPGAGLSGRPPASSPLCHRRLYPALPADALTASQRLTPGPAGLSTARAQR